MALNVYGATTEGVVNASMGFDDQTLEPTYVLRLGSPGKSAGLDIAGRLGIQRELIAQARSRMSTQERDIERFLSEMQNRVERLTHVEKELTEQRRALEEREQELGKEFAKREAAKFKELDQKLQQAVAEFEAQAQETIHKIMGGVEQRKAAEQAERRVAKVRREFEETARAKVFEQAPLAAAPVAMAITEGSRVRLKGVREPARVRKKLSGGILEVDAGLMKMRISTDDVEEVLPETPDAARLPKNVSFSPGPTWDVSYREINVVGQRAEEARDLVDKFLDSATMASVDRVRIVHGHGMGVLRKVVGELLSTHPHVEKFYPASPAEGGTGATVVELK
jgi:DNA mismatch repair protein MutS2